LVIFFVIFETVFADSNIVSLSQLNQKIQQGPQRKVGFLSEGNYHTVQNELSSLVEPIYFENTDELHQGVNQENVLAGLVSGTPDDSYDLNIFGSDQISIRSMLVKPGNDLILDALDAALVRIIERGDVEKIAEKNHPYQALVVHSCKPSSSHFDWPQLKNNSRIKIAALGPYQWGGTDGDYTKEPFVGFWPDYYNLIEQEFINRYNITFERVWYKTSKGVMDSLLSNETDTTEPYMMVGAAYQDFSRKSTFSLSCITSATQDKYFTKKYSPQEPTVESTNRFILPLAITFGALFILSGVFIYVMYIKERQGLPIFRKKLLEPIDPASVIQNNQL